MKKSGAPECLGSLNVVQGNVRVYRPAAGKARRGRDVLPCSTSCCDAVIGAPHGSVHCESLCTRKTCQLTPESGGPLCTTSPTFRWWHLPFYIAFHKVNAAAGRNTRRSTTNSRFTSGPGKTAHGLPAPAADPGPGSMGGHGYGRPCDPLDAIIVCVSVINYTHTHRQFKRSKSQSPAKT